MKDATGLWVYRLAFVMLVGMSLALINTVLQARLAWYPSYEEKLLLKMKQIELSLQPPAKPDLKHKGKVRRHARNARVRS